MPSPPRLNVSEPSLKHEIRFKTPQRSTRFDQNTSRTPLAGAVEEIAKNALARTSGGSNSVGGIFRSHEAAAQSGIPIQHTLKLSSHLQSRASRVVLAIRQVNPNSTILIEQGAAVKGMDDTKRKTSDCGPMAGFIPVDVRLSKESKACIQDTFEKATAKKETKPGISPAQLTLKKVELAHMLKAGLISLSEGVTMNHGDDSTSLLPIEINPKTSQSAPVIAGKFEFFIKASPGNAYQVFYAEKKTGAIQPKIRALDVVSIVGDGESQPIHLTADYDIYSVIPHLGDFGAKDLPYSKELHELGASKTLTDKKTPPLSHIPENLRDTFLPAELQRPGTLSTSEIKSGPKSERLAKLLKAATYHIGVRMLGQHERLILDKEVGVMTSLQRQLKNEVNNLLRPNNQGGELVKHGTEMDNPKPEPIENVFFILPTGQALFAKTKDDVKNVMYLLKQLDYVSYENRRSPEKNWAPSESLKKLASQYNQRTDSATVSPEKKFAHKRGLEEQGQLAQFNSPPRKK